MAHLSAAAVRLEREAVIEAIAVTRARRPIAPRSTPVIVAFAARWGWLTRVMLPGDSEPLYPSFVILELRFLTPPDQIAARYSLGCDCRSCLASTFRPVGVSIFSASSFSSRCSAS